MLQETGENGLRVIESDQHTDTFLSTLVDERVGVRLCSVRCQESQEDGTPNQDYVRVVFAPDCTSLSFCVCDGVGGSYLGDFAARYLALRLTETLSDLPKIPRHPYKTAVALRKQLEIWAGQAQPTLKNIALPPTISALEGEILQEQRDQYGSETVFFCGRVDNPRLHTTRKATHSLPALFCWMGNVTARVFLASHSRQDLGDRNNDRNRWSTHFGQQGMLSMWSCRLSRSEPLLVHTDGLDALTQELTNLDDRQLQVRLQQLLCLPANDDMTLLELGWREDGLV